MFPFVSSNLLTLTLCLPPGRVSMVLLFPGERGAPHFLPSACSLFNNHRGVPSVCMIPSRPQGRKDANSGLGLLMHVVWAQRPAWARGKSYGKIQPLKLLEKAFTQPSSELWCLSPLVSDYVLGTKSVNKVTRVRLCDRQRWSSSLNNSADCFSYTKVKRTTYCPAGMAELQGVTDGGQNSMSWELWLP